MPLHFASERNHSDVVQLLIENGANIDQAREGGATALFMASSHGSLDAVQTLLKNGADVTRAKDCGCAPLHAAAQINDKSIVRLLLKHNADPNARNTCSRSLTNKNDTPLHSAARQGHSSVVKVLTPLTKLADWELAELGELVSSKERDTLRLRQCAGCQRVQLLGKERFKRCARCGVPSYCGKSCQVKHWKVHKLKCDFDIK